MDKFDDIEMTAQISLLLYRVSVEQKIKNKEQEVKITVICLLFVFVFFNRIVGIILSPCQDLCGKSSVTTSANLSAF